MTIEVLLAGDCGEIEAWFDFSKHKH